VSQLNIKLDQERLEALRRYAARRRTPVAWLIKDYVEYLLAGGDPVRTASFEEELSSQQLAAVIQHGGAFHWLNEEPEIYSVSDGEPV